MASNFVFSVSELDFEYKVIEYSKQTPVVVDFWAEWHQPCRVLDPLLERLAEEARGAFMLAKVDVDANPNLTARFNVRSIPAVKAFRDGQVAAEFVGALPEPRLREFLHSITPSETDLTLEKAQGLLELQNWSTAETIFRQYLAKNPGHPAGMLGLLKCFLAQGEVAEAQRLLLHFPSSREYAAAELLRPLATALGHSEVTSDHPLEAAYQRALQLIRRGNLPAAMDGLLDILREDRQYGDSKARHILLALFELLGENNLLTRSYRNELANVLF